MSDNVNWMITITLILSASLADAIGDSCLHFFGQKLMTDKSSFDRGWSKDVINEVLWVLGPSKTLIQKSLVPFVHFFQFLIKKNYDMTTWWGSGASYSKFIFRVNFKNDRIGRVVYFLFFYYFLNQNLVSLCSSESPNLVKLLVRWLF